MDQLYDPLCIASGILSLDNTPGNTVGLTTNDNKERLSNASIFERRKSDAEMILPRPAE